MATFALLFSFSTLNVFAAEDKKAEPEPTAVECTSYPEYQCNPVATAEQVAAYRREKLAKKEARKAQKEAQKKNGTQGNSGN